MKHFLICVKEERMDPGVYQELQKKLDIQIKKIEQLADQKAEEIEQSYYDKYYNYYDIAVRVLKKHNVLLYGGTAINEILPKESRFYKEKELPDIDVFCTNSEPIAKDIMETFTKKGYSLTTVKEALHENTYKVMVEGLQLIDLTVLEKGLFQKLKKGGLKTSFGIPTVNVDYLKYSLHSMLSKPFDAHRWPKVFQRLIRLYDAYPVKLDDIGTFHMERYYLRKGSGAGTVDTAADPEEILTDWATKRQLIHFGWDVIQTYLKEDTTIPEEIRKVLKVGEPGLGMPIHYLLIERDAIRVANQWVKSLNRSDIAVHHLYDGDGLLPPYVCISYKGEKWVYLFESSNCVSFMEYKGRNILSIHGLIKSLYEMYLASSEPELRKILQVLVTVQLNQSLSRKKLYQQFILNCYGYQAGVVTLRKERYLRMLKKKGEP